MRRVPRLRFRLLAPAVVCAVAIGFSGGGWTTAAASPGERDQRAERSEPPKLDELLNRFPVGTKHVLEDSEPASLPAADSPSQRASGSGSTWIAVLRAAGAVVLLAAVGTGAVALAVGRRRTPTHATSRLDLAWLHRIVAVKSQAYDTLQLAAVFTGRSPPVSEVSQDRNGRQVDLQPAEAEQGTQYAGPQLVHSEPVREQEYTRPGDRVAAILTKTPVEAAGNGGVAQGSDELEAPVASDEVDYIERNRAAWERWAPDYAAAGRKAWQEKDLRWGIWGIPESELGIFASRWPGGDVVELGCGTAVVSAWLARRGVRPVAIDIAPTQLRTADTLQREFRLSFPLVCANAEHVPFDDASFDVAISEYGASLWCDPRRWLPEAHRLLRPGGRLVFFTNGALLMACTPSDGGPAGDSLVSDYFSTDRVEFPGEDTVEFHPTHGRWVQLLVANGFALENLIEVRPPPGAEAARFEFASLEWARRWASEEIWVARKVA
jgi:SAM-dependent methyltransferase